MSSREHSWQAHEPGPRLGYRRAGTVVAVLVSVLSGLVVVAFAGSVPGMELVAFGALLLSLLVSVGLIWRTRVPVALCLLSSALTILVPLDAFAALLAWSWVITLRRGPWPWVCGLAAAAATTATLLRDHLRPAEHSILGVTDPVTEEVASAAPSGYVTLGVLLLVVFGGWGVLRRLRWATRAARRAELVRTREAAALRAELSRQEERNLIAREMHDTVAHHLSLVALQASALEIGDDDPEAARTIRGAAQRALDEMRELISELRDGAGPAEDGGSRRSMAELSTLVEEARAAGASLSSSIYLDGADHAPSALTRTVYRILQEALTNALRHAPQEHVTLTVTGSPGTGIAIEVRNRLPSRSPTVAGAGTGILGMGERARSVGGELAVEQIDGEHVLRAHLPWSEPAAS